MNGVCPSTRVAGTPARYGTTLAIYSTQDVLCILKPVDGEPQPPRELALPVIRALVLHQLEWGYADSEIARGLRSLEEQMGKHDPGMPFTPLAGGPPAPQQPGGPYPYWTPNPEHYKRAAAPVKKLAKPVKTFHTVVLPLLGFRRRRPARDNARQPISPATTGAASHQTLAATIPSANPPTITHVQVHRAAFTPSYTAGTATAPRDRVLGLPRGLSPSVPHIPTSPAITSTPPSGGAAAAAPPRNRTKAHTAPDDLAPPDDSEDGHDYSLQEVEDMWRDEANFLLEYGIDLDLDHDPDSLDASVSRHSLYPDGHVAGLGLALAGMGLGQHQQSSTADTPAARAEARAALMRRKTTRDSRMQEIIDFTSPPPSFSGHGDAPAPWRWSLPPAAQSTEEDWIYSAYESSSPGWSESGWGSAQRHGVPQDTGVEAGVGRAM
ncbi:uncharacterized protein LOC62_05G007512 [Vanrija pseudolonga]|uniref:Uncharacterized protein n=1 Tax=Vanrija pseudolonga TaxID=143232 RepID=A0AAF1BJX7_9TREE|nr:hypothetical protein LOC62_05G007512 [Vanrija pseudolonga]